MIKSRTMTNARDADGALKPDSERLTDFGRWVRATSIDELPEFVNVLKGDTSLVGRFAGRSRARQTLSASEYPLSIMYQHDIKMAFPAGDCLRVIFLFFM